jgi:CRISPR/Cas system-associated exonuclease Cas4 (RecB family)
VLPKATCTPTINNERPTMDGDLTPYLQPTKNAIDEYWKSTYKSYTRKIGTLRASELGDACDRKLWYRSKGLQEPAPEPRVLRLFDRGHREEERVVAWLEGIGCKVWGDQKRVVHGDRFSGHIDGLVLGVKEAPEKTHLLEIKTYNDKNFKKLNKDGIPNQHYVQMQVYMYLLHIDRALYIAVNKNDDDIYVKRLKLDKKFTEAQLMRADRISASETPPARIGNNKPTWFECRWCGFSEECFKDE